MRKQAYQEDHLQLKAEEKAQIYEEARMEADGGEYARLMPKCETRISEETRLKAEA